MEVKLPNYLLVAVPQAWLAVCRGIIMKICLVVIYNHQYNRNIKIINSIYENKFSRIVHLMPFYDGEPDEDIVTIYESSWCYQGFIAQGCDRFIKEEYDYYLFLGDDCILNPKITEDSLCDYFELSESSAYIKRLEALSYKKGMLVFPRFDCYISQKGIGRCSECDENNHFAYIKRARGRILEDTREFKIEKYIPPKERMRQIFMEHQIEIDKYAPPLLLSFSDLVICPKNGIKDFCRLCGAFAAVNLHVEMAIPTALAITYKKIVTEEDLKKHGKNGLQNHKNTEIKNMNNIASLFKDNILFIHPVKLSKCRI